MTASTKRSGGNAVCFIPAPCCSRDPPGVPLFTHPTREYTQRSVLTLLLTLGVLKRGGMAEKCSAFVYMTHQCLSAHAPQHDAMRDLRGVARIDARDDFVPPT